jgi:hypothetical protein
VVASTLNTHGLGTLERDLTKSMEPRTLVIGGDPGHWSYRSVPEFHRLTNGVAGWVTALQADYVGPRTPARHVLAGYDLIIANLNAHHIPHYVALAESRPPGQRWVSLVEGCACDYLDPSTALLRVLNASDLVAVINADTTAYFRLLCRARVEWIGVPYPVHDVGALATPWESRRDEILVCPRHSRSPSLLVAEALSLPVRAYFPRVAHTTRNLGLFLRHGYSGVDLWARAWQQEAKGAPRIGQVERGLTDFWREAGACRVWIDLDPRFTWARFVLDAAALGVPIITTDSTAHGRLLFPDTTVESVFRVDEAIAIGRRLLEDETAAHDVVRAARQKLSLFTPDACLGRLAAGLQQEPSALVGGRA